MRDVVITGMGLVSALGHTVEEAVTAAWRGEDGFRRCDALLHGGDGEALGCRVAATVEGFDAMKWVPRRVGGWHDRSTAYALAAVDEALGEAGLDIPGERVGTIIGQAAPGNTLYHQALKLAFTQGSAASLPGRMLPQMSGHIASATVALQQRFKGPSFSVVDACATGATALALAADTIRLGRADAMVAGATDAPIGLTIFGSMLSAGAMHRTDDPERACRPFCADRAGLVVGEGAAILVLEAEETARARGARIYGRMLGEAQTNDAFHIYSPEPTGTSWSRTMSLALAAAGRRAADVDWVSAHAASTGLGDAVEVLAVRDALGPRAGQIPVSSTKSMHGHTFGAAGAIETVLAIAAMNRGWILPTANLTQPDEACDLDHVPDYQRLGSARTLLKNSFGFGGTNTCMVLEAA